MMGLLLLAVLADASGAPDPHRFDVGASFSVATNGLVGFGGALEGLYGFKLWETASADGTLETGLLLGYQATPYEQFATLVGEAQVSGATHSLQAWLVVGHGLRLLPSRRLQVSVQLFAGWSEVLVRGALKNEAVGVSGASVANAGTFATGVMLQLGFRLTEHLSITARATAPFPYALAINPWFMADLGLAWQVR